MIVIFCSIILPYRWIFDCPSGQPHMSWFPITNSQVCINKTGTILMLHTSITLHHLEAKLMLYIHWENPSPLFTGLVTIYTTSKMLAQRYQKKMLKCNKNNYKVYKKTVIIIKSTDISLDRQALSASVIWFEKLSRDHQLSWRKLLKIIILNFILYIIQVYMYTNLKQYVKNEKM